MSDSLDGGCEGAAGEIAVPRAVYPERVPILLGENHIRHSTAGQQREQEGPEMRWGPLSVLGCWCDASCAWSCEHHRTSRVPP